MQTSSPVVVNSLVKNAVQVHKFGGSSLAQVESIKRAINIIKTHCQLHDIVVVSANGNTTNELIAIYDYAVVNDENVHQAIENLKAKHIGLINDLLHESNAQTLIQLLNADFSRLHQWLQIDITAHYSDLLAFGEVWSSRLLSAVLNEQVCPSYALDARDFLVIDNEASCQVDYPLSGAQLRQHLKFGKLAVVTGFIAKNSQGLPCTLGRNGSDYSATILANLCKSQQVTLWTDVDGIYSADPRVVPNARKLHRVPRGVANELGRLGNPVLHEKTLQPLSEAGTHLHIASSFDPKTVGTEVGDFGQIAKQELSVTYANDLLLAQSDSFIGEEGRQASKSFNAFCGDEDKGIIVIRLSQQKAISEWLASHDTEVKFTPVSLLAIVGHKVAKRGQIKARFKRALKSSSPLHIYSGEHSHSLIAILPEVCTSELVNNVHHDLTKDARHIGVVIAGVGNIGQRFIEMLPNQLAQVNVLENMHLVGVISSSNMLINADGIEIDNVFEEFAEQSQPYQAEQLLDWLSQRPYDELVIVDITPSEEFSQLYQAFFERGIHVISANKWAGSSQTKQYNKLIKTAKKHDCLWLGNTTVGAGLPINYAIDDINKSGDSIVEIAGIFSGTLSWLFEKYTGEEAFSALLLKALDEGITEPDPRDDLSGRDVQRKLLILARAAGFELDLADITCNNLVPEHLRNLPLAEFLTRTPELDNFFADKLAQAQEAASCIRYVARFSVDGEKISAQVALETLPVNDAFAQLTPCDNIFQIKSGWYQNNPLIIRGPGAGRDVTAGGLHSDLVNMAKQLVNKQHQVKLKGLN